MRSSDGAGSPGGAGRRSEGQAGNSKPEECHAGGDGGVSPSSATGAGVNGGGGGAFLLATTWRKPLASSSSELRSSHPQVPGFVAGVLGITGSGVPRKWRAPGSRKDRVGAKEGRCSRLFSRRSSDGSLRCATSDSDPLQLAEEQPPISASDPPEPVSVVSRSSTCCLVIAGMVASSDD